MLTDECYELRIAYLESRFLWSFAQILLLLVVHFTDGRYACFILGSFFFTSVVLFVLITESVTSPATLLLSISEHNFGTSCSA